jgi:hypothetical protein
MRDGVEGLPTVCVASSAAAQSAVTARPSMRSFPIGQASLAAIVLPIVAPMLVVATLQIPIRELLLGLVKALI